jgi:hypothetical protein
VQGIERLGLAIMRGYLPGVEPYTRRQPSSLGQRSDQCDQ